MPVRSSSSLRRPERRLPARAVACTAILGRLSSNGRLVPVNPAGIAVGESAPVDTASFTASTPALSADDAAAGRLRFAAAGSPGALRMDGRVHVTGGDIVLVAPDLQGGEKARLHAKDGSVVLAAGQKVAITGRGLEGITMELVAPGDQVLNLGRLDGDAVGIFAAQLSRWWPIGAGPRARTTRPMTPARWAGRRSACADPAAIRTGSPGPWAAARGTSPWQTPSSWR